MPLFGPPNIEEMKSKRDIPGLIKALDYKTDFKVIIAAMQGLQSVGGDTRALKPLFTILRDTARSIAERQPMGLAYGPLIMGLAYRTLVMSAFKLPSSSPNLELLPNTGDEYVEDCFHFDLQELPDDRDWHQIPQARAITSIENFKNAEERMHAAEALLSEYPDYYFPYSWLSYLNNETKKYDIARKFLLEGLRKSKKKYILCEDMAEVELADNYNLAEAAKWWIRSIINQVGIANTNSWTGSHDSFLYLSYVAERFWLYEACFWLRLWSDRITVDMMRLNAEYSGRIYDATFAQGIKTESVKKAITLLHRAYLSKVEIETLLKPNAEDVTHIIEYIHKTH